MKKILAMIITVALLLSLIGCNINGTKKALTMEKVIELSEKGSDLTWSDFENYSSIETGSGLYILVYDIDNEYSVWIGGASTDEKPMYIRLVRKDDLDDYIDIRTEDIESFIG